MKENALNAIFPNRYTLKKFRSSGLIWGSELFQLMLTTLWKRMLLMPFSQPLYPEEIQVFWSNLRSRVVSINVPAYIFI
jgi:hypothetical protein